MQVKKLLSHKYSHWWILGLGAVILLVAAIFWYSKVSITPERVFWGAVDRSLRTHGVTLSGKQTNGQDYLEQTIQYELGGNARTVTRSTLSQGGSTVVTESFGNTENSYTRYAHIQTGDADRDFTKVLGVWGKASAAQQASLNQSVLGLLVPLGAMPLPIGMLQDADRTQMLSYMRENTVYQIDYSNVKKQTTDGRLQYAYPVSMTTQNYAEVLKRFAASLGMHDFDALDPQSFKDSPAISITIVVDVRSRHVASVTVNDVGYEQKFSGYDLAVRANEPAESIDASELQKRLYEL